MPDPLSARELSMAIASRASGRKAYIAGVPIAIATDNTFAHYCWQAGYNCDLRTIAQLHEQYHKPKGTTGK